MYSVLRGDNIIEYFLQNRNRKMLINIGGKEAYLVIYENVEAIAKEKGIAITALEEKAKLGRGTIGKWRTSKPVIDNIKKVADVLEVPLEALLED